MPRTDSSVRATGLESPTENPGADGSAGVRTERVSKRFPNPSGAKNPPLEVLTNIGLSIGPGEFVALTGHSGCGKTTLLRILMGLEVPDEGRVFVGDREVSGCGMERAMVFQHANLLPWRTAAHNVELGLESLGLSKVDRRKRALEMLQLVGLADAADRRPHHLSGGMRQRVGLARALATEPSVLLMDEPFGALDAQTREVLQEEILRLHRMTRKTIVFVTHDLDEAALLADRIIVMASGPGRVADTIPVSLDRSTGNVLDIAAQPEFDRVRRRLREVLRSSA
jgi:NitT/TauT family transport system ATP-binding protein